MLCHVWAMTLKPGVSDDAQKALVEAMAALVERIDGIRSFRSGADLGLVPRNADVALVAEFDDEQAWRCYLEAPAHAAFVTDHVNAVAESWTAIQFIVPTDVPASALAG